MTAATTTSTGNNHSNQLTTNTTATINDQQTKQMKDVSSVVDTRISRIRPLIPPVLLLEEIPSPIEIQQFVQQQRQATADIIHHKNDRLLVVVGPCSIHDPQAAMEYAQKLAPLVLAKQDTLQICMRVYFEKPRTTIGWKGLINDPELDGTFAINRGLRIARKLMLDINKLSIPIACEVLDTISHPQFLSDLMCWAAVGARTTESQLHRELSSGLSMPVGFKNGTTGSIKIATDAMIAAKSPHCFLSVTNQGLSAIVETIGNNDTSLILRGSDAGPNHQIEFIKNAEIQLAKSKVAMSIVIDASHGNSQKDHNNQKKVIESICQQVASGCTSITGCMIESNLVAGAQKLVLGHKSQLKYGQSITDACIDFEETIKLIDQLEQSVIQRRQHCN